MQVASDIEELVLGCPSHLAVLQMQESRGAHAREDFDKRDDENWMKHTLGYWDSEKKNAADRVDITYRAVHDQPLDSEMNHIPPKARTY